MKVINHAMLVAVSVSLLALGCAADEQAPVEEGMWLADTAASSLDGKSDSSGRTVATQNLNAAHFLGYDPVFDRVTPNPCVDVIDAELGPTEPRFRVPTLRFINSRQQLAEELGIDLRVGGSLDVARAEVGFKLLNQFSRSTNTVAFLLRVTEDYAVLRRPGEGAVSLSARGRDLLEAGDLNAFVSECGSHYVNGVRYGAEIDVLLTFTATDERHVNELTATLGAEAVGVPVDLDAQARQRLENSSQNLEVSITTASGGFSLAVPPEEVENLGAECAEVFRTIGGQGETDEQVDSLLAELVVNQQEALPRLFSHIDCLKELMHVSLARDANRCRAEGACHDGNAAPQEVILEEYRSAEASDLLQQLDVIETERRRLGQELDALGSMRVRTRSAYWDEIAPFLTAEQERKATFAAPDAEVADLAGLQAIADKWAGTFSPATDRPGAVDLALSEAIDECHARASNDLFHLCTPNLSGVAQSGFPPLDRWRPLQPRSIAWKHTPTGSQAVRALHPAYAAAADALRQYEAERIVPLQVVIAPEPMNYRIAGIADAVEFCEDLGQGYRLPRVDEIADLDLLVRAGPVPDHTMWVSDDDDECAISGAYYDPSAEQPLDCSTLGSRGTVCVNAVGPFPVLEQL